MSKQVIRVLFVCMGNICRSPAAEGVMRAMSEKLGVADRWEIASAGTIGFHSGALPDPRMRAAAAKRSYSLVSRARKFIPADLERYDLILPMDEDNLKHVLALATRDEQRAKVLPFWLYCRRHKVTHVPDPYYGGEQGFEHVLDLLEDGCLSLIEQYAHE